MNKAITILICDDDEDDVYLLKSVMEECDIKNPIVYAKNGLEAIANLNSPALQNRIGLVPVSYTHLDVYKRQAQRRCPK